MTNFGSLQSCQKLNAETYSTAFYDVNEIDMHGQ